MKLETTAAFLLVALAMPVLASAEDPRDDRSSEVYPADPVGPEGGDYDVAVDLDGSAPVSVSTFEAPLASYGDWISVGAYGQVWRPRVPAGWRPYYYGRWEWTTEGWLWLSDEPFGWATYHYGRWTFDRGYGWLWVPGVQWAPAWVTWRYGGDAVGWAPLAPGLSVYVTDFAFVDSWWTFVPTNRFCGVPVYGAAYAPGYTHHWYDVTRPAPPRPVPPGGYRPVPGRMAPPAWGGPGARFVEERTGRPLRPYRIVPSATSGFLRGRPGEIGVYRPEARPLGAPGGFRGGRPPAAQPYGYGRGETPRAVPAPGLEQRGRGPASALPPGRGWRPEPGAAPGRGRVTDVPAPSFERGGRAGARPGFAPPAPVQRAPASQPPAAQAAPEPRFAPAPRPAPEPRFVPAPAPGRGEERGRGEHRR